MSKRQWSLIKKHPTTAKHTHEIMSTTDELARPQSSSVVEHDPEVGFESITVAIYIEEQDELHPPAVFRQSYREMPPYQNTAFGEVTLKKTKTGHKVKSGVKIDRVISPKRCWSIKVSMKLVQH
jgi:hypothetical protein